MRQEHGAFRPGEDRPLSGHGDWFDQRLHFLGWALVAVIPGNVDRFSVGKWSPGKHKVDNRVDRPAAAIGRRTFGSYRERRGQADGAENRVEDVTAHVPKG